LEIDRDGKALRWKLFRKERFLPSTTST